MITLRPARRRLRTGVAVIAAMLLLAAGCGSDSDASHADATFVADYERVTADFEERTDAVRAQGREALGTGGDAVLGVYQQLLDATRAAHEQYRDLEPVDDVEAAYEKLVTELEKQAEVLSAVVAAAEAGDDSALSGHLQELASVVVEVTNARRAVDRQIEDLGS